jgi:hypothetical protein
MKSTLIRFVLVVLATVVWTNTAPAQNTLFVPAVYNGGPNELRISVCIAGDGDPLAEAWLLKNPSTNIDATITANIRDIVTTLPIANFPFEDIWLEFGGANLCSCNGGIMLADADSDVNGDVAFSRSLYAGGWAINPTIRFYVSGTLEKTVTTSNFRINGFNYVCDNIVSGPSDQAAFSLLWNASDWRADLSHNGKWTPWDNHLLAVHAGLLCMCP